VGYFTDLIILPNGLNVKKFSLFQHANYLKQNRILKAPVLKII